MQEPRPDNQRKVGNERIGFLDVRRAFLRQLFAVLSAAFPMFIFPA